MGMLTRDRMMSQRSSGLLLLLWLGLIIYGTIKLRTLSLLSLDNVRASPSLHYTHSLQSSSLTHTHIHTHTHTRTHACTHTGWCARCVQIHDIHAPVCDLYSTVCTELVQGASVKD